MSKPEERRHRCLAQALTACVELSRRATLVASREGGAKLVHNAPLAVLALLFVNGPLRPRDLHGHVHLTTGGLSNLLARLESSGLVVRHRSTGADQRGVEVELTPRGEKQISQLADAVFASFTLDEALLKEAIVAFVEGGVSWRTGGLPAVSPPPIRVVLGLATIGIAFQRALDPQADGEPTPDTNAQIALITLLELGPCRAGRLAELLAITSAGASRLLDRLEQSGLVERRAAEDDGRSLEVVLTSAGRRHVATVLDQTAPYLEEMLGALRLVLQELHSDL